MSSNSLVDALKARTDAVNLAFCKFTQIREQLDEEEQSALDNAVDSIRSDAGMGKAKAYSASWLAKVLRNFGYNVSISTVQRHVNKECSCERVIR